MPIQTPQSITEKILQLCHRLNPDAQPVFLNINPEKGAEINNCFWSVGRKVESDGGRIQFGWAIWEWPNVFIEAENHAVYEPPASTLWIDISPSPRRDITRRLFLPDDTAVYDFENEGVRRDNVRAALAGDPLISEFFDLAHERTEILNAIPGIGEVHLEGEVARRFDSNQERAAMIEYQLGMKYTPRTKPCFCGSGQKFKRCHDSK